MGFKIRLGIGSHLNLLECILPFQMLAGGSVRTLGYVPPNLLGVPQSATLLAGYPISNQVILDIELPDSPMDLLLHVPNIPLSHYHKLVLPHLLNTARKPIPVY